MTLYMNINSIKMKTVGAVMFIRLLLMIAGVEPNPGPTDKLVFRYQYLLIKVGTELLRKLYDVKVSSYNDFNKDLKGLLATNILTNDQKKLLPPLDKNPNTANYDITLLTCLLRNICGLKHHLDPVWTKPANTDFTVEAEITRLRDCRNYVVHKGTVHMSETDFNQKWSELCQILRRLNNFCSVPDLQKMIDDATNEPLDDQLKQDYDSILRAWHEADSLFEKGIDHIKISQSEIKGAVCDMKEGQSDLKDGQFELKLGQSHLKDGQSDLKDGQSKLKDGQSELKDGQSELKSELKDGQSELKDGQSKLKDGQSKLKNGQSELKDGLSELKDGQSELKDGQSQLKDGLENVGKNQKDQTKLLQNVQDVQEQYKRKLDNIEQACTSNTRNIFFTDNDIKKRLRKSYENYFRTVCVTPLYSEDDQMDMLTVYSRSEMKHVPYHRTRKCEGNYEIASYEQVFSKNPTFFRNIFVTGDAGMGKTSFCQFMSLLWSKAIADDIVGNTETLKDASFMTNFDFVFYISLKETSRVDVVNMIVDKYFFTSSNDKNEETIKTIEGLLQTQNCLVILDGLDEWRPDIGGHRNLSLPIKVISDRCTYLTTCRPYRIETVRLSEMVIDHQVKITGFDHEKYIREVISHINKSQNCNKDPKDFMRQINASNMGDQLRIPLLASQLIVIWLNYEMSEMNRAMIYSSIIDMLFTRAINNEIKFLPMTSSDVHLPESFSRFIDLLKYVCTLEKLCRLSFLLLFDPNNETPSLVFTKKQLMSEPYNISSEEIDFLCQLGIISKNKIIANFGEQKHMLSFLHTSYLEFLAALFVSLFDKADFFRESVKKICINNVSKYENFLILLSGISSHMTRIFFEIIYEKDEWDLFRRNCFFAINGNFQSPYDMQNISLSCLKEICVSDNSQSFIKLEDFRFEYLFEHRQNLEKLFVLNKHKHNVKSLKTACLMKEFNEVKGLQYLIIDRNFDVKFKDVMLQNKPTLRGLILRGLSLLSELPVRSLRCLTSIRFERLTIEHNIYHDLMHYISDNSLLENIVLRDVRCEDKSSLLSDKRCQFTLNLSRHSKLLLMDIDNTYIHVYCSEINNSCLTSLRLNGRSSSGRCPRLTNVVNIIQNSKLEYLNLDKDCIHDTEINHVINAISSLKYIKRIELFDFTIESVPLHPDIVCDEYIYIKLNHVTMSDKSFQDFIDRVVHHQSVVRVCIEDFDESPSNFNSWKCRVQKLQANKFVRMLNKFGNNYFTYNVLYENGDIEEVSADYDVGVVDDNNDDVQNDVDVVDDNNDDVQNDVDVVDDNNDDGQDDVGVVDDNNDDGQDDVGVVDDYYDDGQNDVVNCYFKVKFEFETIK